MQAFNVDDLIAGTRCVELARLGRVVIPMRAMAEREEAELARLAELRARVDLGAIDEAPAANVTRSARWPLMIAMLALDPKALRSGRRERLFTPDEAGQLIPADVDALLDAQRRAQVRSSPPLDETELRAAVKALGTAGNASFTLDRLRVRGMTVVEFFSLPLDEITDWQLIYFQELTR